jgi:hypothetical protein
MGHTPFPGSDTITVIKNREEGPSMKTTPLALQPTTIPEWDAEDEMAGVLSGAALLKADELESKAMLDAMRLELPKVQYLEQVKLRRYAQQRRTPLKLTIEPDSAHYDFYLIELPLNILAPKQRLCRLRVQLRLDAGMQSPEQPVAYDLFPNDQTDLKTIMTGAVNLDVSKALKYILTAVGAGAPALPADAFGFKLALPFKWTSAYTRVQTSDRMSNPVEWYVTDQAIQNGFTGHVIIRAPKHAQVKVAATLACEVRKTGLLGRILKAQYISDAHIYPLKE